MLTLAPVCKMHHSPVCFCHSQSAFDGPGVDETSMAPKQMAGSLHLALALALVEQEPFFWTLQAATCPPQQPRPSSCPKASKKSNEIWLASKTCHGPMRTKKKKKKEHCQSSCRQRSWPKCYLTINTVKCVNQRGPIVSNALACEASRLSSCAAPPQASVRSQSTETVKASTNKSTNASTSAVHILTSAIDFRAQKSLQICSFNRNAHTYMHIEQQGHSSLFRAVCLYQPRRHSLGPVFSGRSIVSHSFLFIN